jgi:heme/copper-type cytochrome/quinol oxidase subunit 3
MSPRDHPRRPPARPHPIQRSTEATSAGEVALVARRRLAQPNGWWGMALFVAAEATLFGSLLATYFYLDFNSPQWPPAGIKAPSVVLPLVATGLLISTSVPMWLSARAARSGFRSYTTGFIALASLIQCIYLAGQILLFRHDLNDFRPDASAYGSIYFTVLAAHHAHVLLGILLNGWVLARVGIGGLTNYRLTAVRCVALYWHVVNVLAVLVVLTQLSPSL